MLTNRETAPATALAFDTSLIKRSKYVVYVWKEKKRLYVWWYLCKMTRSHSLVGRSESCAKSSSWKLETVRLYCTYFIVVCVYDFFYIHFSLTYASLPMPLHVRQRKTKNSTTSAHTYKSDLSPLHYTSSLLSLSLTIHLSISRVSMSC